jgi:serine/threonine protein phosphatase PrpC
MKNSITILPSNTTFSQLRLLLSQILSLLPENDPATCYPRAEQFALGTTEGLVREHNEDRVAVMRVHLTQSEPPWMIAAVCDGIGGLKDGARAAEIALSTFLATVLGGRIANMKECLRQCVLDANAAVFADFSGNGGTTISAVAWDSSTLTTANVGDSRIWAFTPSSKLELWTQDDSIAAHLLANGISNVENARRDLLQFVGMGPEICPHIATHPAADSRYVLITSDGAHDIQPDLIRKLLQHGSHKGETVDRLLTLSLWLGGLDNASAICIEPQDVTSTQPGTFDLWVPAGHWRIARAEPSAPINFISTGKSLSSSSRNTTQLVKNGANQVVAARKLDDNATPSSVAPNDEVAQVRKTRSKDKPRSSKQKTRNSENASERGTSTTSRSVERVEVQFGDSRIESAPRPDIQRIQSNDREQK